MPFSVSSNSAKINLTLPPTISGRRFSSVIFRPRKCFWRSDYGTVSKAGRAKTSARPGWANFPDSTASGLSRAVRVARPMITRELKPWFSDSYYACPLNGTAQIRRGFNARRWQRSRRAEIFAPPTSGAQPFLPALMNQRPDLLLIDLSQRFALLRAQGRYVDRFHVFHHLSAVSCTWNDTAHLLVIENPT